VSSDHHHQFKKESKKKLGTCQDLAINSARSTFTLKKTWQQTRQVKE